MAGKSKTKTDSVTISVDKLTLKRLDAYQKRQELSTRSAVVRDWGRIIEGLKAKEVAGG